MIFVYYFIGIVIVVGGTISLVEFFKGAFAAMNNWKEATDENKERLKNLIGWIIGLIIAFFIIYFNINHSN